MVESQQALLEKAKNEEIINNWIEAAKIYKQVAENLLINNKKEESAPIFKKLGDAYSRAALTAELSEEYFELCKWAIEAYEKATNLLRETGNISIELECKALMFYVSSISQFSLDKAKEAASKSIELFVQSSEHYSKRGDKEGTARTLSKAATMSVSLILYCSEQEEVLKVARKGREISEKARRMSEEIRNIDYLAEAMSSEVGIVSDMTVYRLESQILSIFPKRIAKRTYYNCDKHLELIEETNDPRILARIYNVVGRCYIDYGINHIEEEIEQRKQFDEAIKLLKLSVNYALESKDKSVIILNLYEFFQAIAVSGKIDYLIKKRVKFFSLFKKFSEIFAGSSNFWDFLVNLVLANYYSNAVMYSQSFLSTDDKKLYAEKGIVYALKALELTAFTPFCVHLYVILTNFYSMLTYLTAETEKREEYAKDMLELAKKAENVGRKYQEGYPQPTRPQFTYYTALYVAYKTLADTNEVLSKKAEMLQIAANALEKSTIGIKHLRLSLESKLSLGTLYEEISILTKDQNKLSRAKEVFFEAVKESLKTGYTAARISAYDSIARIEDRLGNFTVSAENYEKVNKLYSELLKMRTYEGSREEIKRKRNYINVWILIERAKAYHKIENHLKAKDNYIKAFKILESLPNFSYEAPYYGAWVLLEEAEQFSKEERLEESIEAYTKTKSAFANAFTTLEKSYDLLKEKRDIDRIKKLGKLAKIRIEYCIAKIDLEGGKILEKQSKFVLSAKKFGSAASHFEKICKLFEGERDRNDLQAFYHLCKAWETMQLAEEYKDPDRFEIAASLFTKASEFSTDSRLKLLASGNSVICQALKFGHEFDKAYNKDSKTQLYSKIRALLSEASSLYGNGGFKSEEYWALATSLWFEAIWNLSSAQEELNVNDKKTFLENSSKLLKSAVKIFHKAGYKEKENEIMTRLASLEKQERILMSVSDIFMRPSIIGSTLGIKAPSCPVETSQSINVEDLRQLTPDLRHISKDTALSLIESKDMEDFGEIRDINVFVSYATKDSDEFKVSDIAETLTGYEKISDVLYWQEDMKDNIIKYMNDNLGKCDIMILFCSPNSLASEPVEKEWTAADIMGKPIIPVFKNPDHIPPLLKPRLGVNFDSLNFKNTVEKIYNLIIKKSG